MHAVGLVGHPEHAVYGKGAPGGTRVSGASEFIYSWPSDCPTLDYFRTEFFTMRTTLLLVAAFVHRPSAVGAQATSGCTTAPVCVYLNAARDSGISGVTFHWTGSPDGDVTSRQQLRFGESAVLPCPQPLPVTVQARLNDAACEHEEATIDCLRVFAEGTVIRQRRPRDLVIVATNGGEHTQCSPPLPDAFT